MSTRSYPIFTSSRVEPTGSNAGDIWHDPSTNSVRQRVFLNNTTGVWRTPGVSQNTVTVPTGISITPNCDTSDVVAQAIRAKNMGMKIMIDFHYSDWWADPGKQNPIVKQPGYSKDFLKVIVKDHGDKIKMPKEKGGH